MATIRQADHPSAPGAAHAQARTVAGLLLLAAGSAVLLGIVTAEVLYPAAYDATRNTVSDLAAMRPENLVRQPSAAIFNATLIVSGLLVAAAAVLLHRSGARPISTLPLAGLALGMLGVGFFPGNTVMAVHELVSLLAFLSGALAAILTARLQPRALRPVHHLLGGIALAFLLAYTFFGEWSGFDDLGEGGVERWIVYPVALWLVVLGSGLAARSGDAGGPTA